MGVTSTLLPRLEARVDRPQIIEFRQLLFEVLELEERHEDWLVVLLPLAPARDVASASSDCEPAWKHEGTTTLVSLVAQSRQTGQKKVTTTFCSSLGALHGTIGI